MSPGGEVIEGIASSSGSCSGSPLGPWLCCELELRTLKGAISVGGVKSGSMISSRVRNSSSVGRAALGIGIQEDKSLLGMGAKWGEVLLWQVEVNWHLIYALHRDCSGAHSVSTQRGPHAS